MANIPVRQYIGARYVPLFANPAEWDNTKTYEPLTIVLHDGNSYTSRQYVPAGIDITNTDYWALTGNYNAQVEAYRQEVKNFDARITSNTNNITTNTNNITTNTNNITTNTNNINDINANLTALGVTDTETATRLKTKINRNALYIGNSYTLGIGSSDNQTGIYELTKFIFSETNIVWGDGIGFMPYTGHTETFLTKYQNFITENSEKSQKLTDIVIVSAYGDTRALIAKNNNAQYAQELITVLNNFISLVHTNSPNAMVHVVFAEGTSQENKGGVTVRKEFELDNIFASAIAQLSAQNIRYLGWTGWNITHRANCFSNDGYHPNDHGYNFLATSFIEGFFGTFQEFKDKTNAIPINLNNSSQENALTTTLYVETNKNYSYYRFGTIHVTKPLQITPNTQLCTFSDKICQPPVAANYILDFPLLYSTNFTKGAIDRLSISFDETGSNLLISPVGKTTSNEIPIGEYIVSPYSVTLTHNT